MACGLGQVSAPGSPFRGVVVPAPLHFAGLRIAGIQEAGDVHGIAAHAGDNVILHHQRAGGAEVLHLLVGDLLLPALFSILRIERDEPAVGRHEIQPFAIHPEPAIAHQVPALVLPAVVPDLLAGARIDCPGVIGNREVENAVDHQRSRFDRRIADAALRPDIGDAVEPGERKAADIRGVDLGKRAEAPARVIAVVSRPGPSPASAGTSGQALASETRQSGPRKDITVSFISASPGRQ